MGELQGFIRGLRDRGIGVLLTDHNVRETLNVCTRAYIIHEGKVLAQGTPAEVAADPQVRAIYLGTDFRM